LRIIAPKPCFAVNPNPGSVFRGHLIIGFVAGVIAKFITPGDKEPQGFILTTVLGIIVATYIGQAVGWYQAGQKAGFIGAIVGAVIILLIWGFLDRQRRA
jgi:uncharacterized membrane protein YeaQ/YmgE (transglycosylase-associated protein family)